MQSTAAAPHLSPPHFYAGCPSQIYGASKWDLILAIGLAQHAETSQAVVVDFLQPVAHQEKHAQRQSHRDRNRDLARI